MQLSFQLKPYCTIRGNTEAPDFLQTPTGSGHDLLEPAPFGPCSQHEAYNQTHIRKPDAPLALMMYRPFPDNLLRLRIPWVSAQCNPTWKSIASYESESSPYLQPPRAFQANFTSFLEMLPGAKRLIQNGFTWGLHGVLGLCGGLEYWDLWTVRTAQYNLCLKFVPVLCRLCGRICSLAHTTRLLDEAHRPAPFHTRLLG